MQEVRYVWQYGFLLQEPIIGVFLKCRFTSVSLSTLYCKQCRLSNTNLIHYLHHHHPFTMLSTHDLSHHYCNGSPNQVICKLVFSPILNVIIVIQSIGYHVYK